MASYTYTLTDIGDGATTQYFGTASLAAIVATQSAEFSVSYIEDNLIINTEYLTYDAAGGDSEEQDASGEFSYIS